jgi:hypothetical protein
MVARSKNVTRVLAVVNLGVMLRLLSANVA